MEKKKTKIVATLGPASDSPETIQALYDEGVNVFRLNFSHGDHASHGAIIDKIKALKLNAAIMLDTKGPEIRVGQINDKVHVTIGTKFTMTTQQGIYEDTGKISVNYAEFTEDVDIGDVIIIDSGIVKAECVDKEGDDLTFKVIEGECDITTKRHINLHGRPVSLPTVTDKDWEDIKFGIEKKVDFIALSFVRSGDDVLEVKDFCKKKGAKTQIIAKIENYESTLNWEEIIKASDGIMFARGDLSCEISFGEVPTLQKKMAALCSYYNKPLIIATQMVLSMVENIQPTRAEVSDLGNAIFEGVDAIMTSDETTKGKHPILVIKTMTKICIETERNIYNICDKPDCDDCFGILHRGRLQRCGFETNVKSRKPGVHPYDATGNHFSAPAPKREKSKGKKDKSAGKEIKGVKRKFSCNTLSSHSNIYKENIISILPFITDNIEAIAAADNVDDVYIKNISSSRLNIPMYGFTADKMLSNQMNLCWNVDSVFNQNISEDFVKNAAIIDSFMRKKGFKKYLFVCNVQSGDLTFPTVQVRSVQVD